MKKYIFYISILFVVFCSGCQKDEIVDSKPGEPIPPVTSLAHSISGNTVNLTWKNPVNLPADIKQPVAVVVSISVDGISQGSVVLQNAPESYSYTTYNATKKYRFTVKLRGDVNTTDPMVSNLRYSLGETLAF